MNTGERIKSRRKQLGLTLEDLSVKLEVSKGTIQRYETGEIKNIPSENLELLAKELCVSPSYLMGWDEKFYCPFDLDVISISRELQNDKGKKEFVELVLSLSEDKQDLIKTIIMNLK